MKDITHDFGLVPFFTQQLSDDELMQGRLGRVIEVQRSQCIVVTNDGERAVELSLPLQRERSISRPTVGDWVVLDTSLCRIEKVLERKSLFKRLAAGVSTEVQLIAANIDTIFIVTACNEEFNESRLERYLTLCVESGAVPVIVLTKIDVCDEPDLYSDRARSVKANIPVEMVNALDSSSMDGVRAWIDANSTVALVGSSGVGKSTLLNTLAGHTVAGTQETRIQDQKGRHTTTHRALYKLPTGGLLIDVPGMREIKVADIEQSLGTVFEDIESFAALCQFSDCSHQSEPGCAVRQALEAGDLDERRVSSYMKLCRENSLATMTLAEKRAKGREFAKVVKRAKSFKENKNDR
jgi:ribosome biogenesis GTPase / thiamine phosphate phosphatase